MGRLIAALTLAALTLSVGAPASSHSLVAVVGPGVLTLSDAGGADVNALAPGTYSLTVEDRSQVHNFHLEGPGVSQSTGLTFTGAVTWTVTLRDGVYTFSSDPQAGDLNGRLVVGTPPPPRLFATVTDTGITLVGPDGRPATQLEPGEYAIDVDDRSARESFRLAGPGVNEHTQRHVPFRTVWQVTLRDGVYHFFSDRRPAALHGSVRVGGGAATADTVLRGVTGSDFAISLTGADHAPLARRAPGRYTIEIEDRSPDHNFRLTGPGVNVATTLEEVGRRTFAVTLRPGTYSFLCDPHTLTMFASFTVPAAPAARLGARLTAAGVATLTAAGRPVGSLRAGAYLVTVRDGSAIFGFRLRGPGVRKTTGARFRGTRVWRVQLRAGVYRYGAGARLHTLRVR